MGWIIARNRLADSLTSINGALKLQVSNLAEVKRGFWDDAWEIWEKTSCWLRVLALVFILVKVIENIGSQDLSSDSLGKLNIAD